MKTNIYVVCTALLLSAGVHAQTFNHDPTKMNQFMVKETGAGALVPTEYYYTLHRSYQAWAQGSPKLLWRGALTLSLPKEESYADSIRADLKKRSDVELVNMVDRNKVFNMSWMAQRSKVNNKLFQFKDNIERICFSGGTPAERKSWLGIYNQITCGINVIGKCYLSNSKRLKAYMDLYGDIVKFNNQLCHRLIRLDNDGIVNFDNGVQLKKPNKNMIIRRSCIRFQSALYAGWRKGR